MINNLNDDYNKRDEILFGSYDEDKYLGGIRRFSCTPNIIKELLNEHFIDPNEAQNTSPTIDQFLQIVSGIEKTSRFNGYAVSPDRCDYRVTIDTIEMQVSDKEYNKVAEITRILRDADEFDMHHNCNGTYTIYAWWD